MANEIIKIKCPQCGAVLSIRNIPGLETKNVNCPVCKYKGPFTSYRAYVPHQPNQADQTDYGYGDKTQYKTTGSTGGTQSGNDFNILPGQLRVLSTGKVYKLKFGTNIIGRQALHSSATLQLPTDGSKRMSRDHLVIEVKKLPGKGLTAYVSLYKEKVNKTFINNDQLLYGDTLVLKDGDVISLPDLKVKYEIPDEEKTQM